MVTQLHLPTGKWDSAPRILYSQDEELGIPKVRAPTGVNHPNQMWCLG